MARAPWSSRSPGHGRERASIALRPSYQTFAADLTNSFSGFDELGSAYFEPSGMLARRCRNCGSSRRGFEPRCSPLTPSPRRQRGLDGDPVVDCTRASSDGDEQRAEGLERGISERMDHLAEVGPSALVED